jgi:hypothetical protein
MQKLQINNEAINMPTSWAEVSLSQFKELKEAKSDIDICGILSGIEPERLKRAKDIEGFNRLLIAGEFVKEPPKISKKKSLESISFEGNTFSLIELTEIEIGQYNDIRHLASNGGDELEQFAVIMAIYLQPITSGENYSYSSAKELIAKVWQMPALEVIASVNFFLERSIGLRRSRRSLSSVVSIAGKRLWRALIGWKGLALSIRSPR